jgi:rhodanese-related sulfurtransferase/predicted peroxiredoxin
MCSTSKVDDMLKGLASGEKSTSPSSTVVNFISVTKLKHSRDDFLLVDIREPSEIENSEPLPKETVADVCIPMGKLFAESPKYCEEWKGKQVVLVCATGERSQVCAERLCRNSNNKNNIHVLSRGIVGLSNTAAVMPDFLVVLGTKSNAEKITLALTAAATAASNNETVVIALIGDGVCTFLRHGNNKEEASLTSFRVEQVFVGEPFKPTNVLLSKMIATGNASILACTSCCASRKIEFGSDLLDCVMPMQMPDLLRMLGECKKNLQFM